MRYGFAIDQRTCIGCHACTVACKTEHEVPVGQFRTWVKYVDKGEFPTSTREFAVMRCNHCSDAPCVKICPTQALFTRPDGIVDFDSDRCIGCKSCQQACPYDAIYIDEDTHTAAKCNFCAHRVDSGLEPACVTVCPTHSIWVGDISDPTTGISRLLASHPTAVRSPEQNTQPNVYYVGADRTTLDPLAAPVGDTYIFADPDPLRAWMARHSPVETLTQARTTLNTAHPRPWGPRVTAYLWTKSVGAGVLAAIALASVLGLRLGVLGRVVGPVLALGFVAVTGVLLVWDLKRPDRFYYIFTKPNPRSWLFWGSVALGLFSVVAGVWVLLGALGEAGVLSPVNVASAIHVLRWLAFPVAGLTAGYTGFLFGQAEGRDLWQSPLLFWHLLVQAWMVGAGVLLVAAPFERLPGGARAFLVESFVVAVVAHILVLALEYGGRHPTRAGAAAAHLITHGPYAPVFWGVAVGLAALAAGLAAGSWGGVHVLAWAVPGAVLSQVALLGYESVFVRAGQDVPLS